ncbi:hypothetical protein [Microbispora sp. KK1-11]|uniref:hypothetical protein n=1 Tax=Microbispora sp. KK1-11 TaxID=2053005 RepID=UPI001159AA1A|nr:hypothetical protein [Microbispora sp. KK1-11]TQS19868.1 hypothetical protein FLW16_41340 [Microbispora sp. KK1-11]
MHEPTYGGIPLGREAGAAFSLQTVARDSAIAHVDGWEVEVRKDQKIVVARGGKLNGYDTAFRSGLDAAQKGLDLMSMSGKDNLAIKSWDMEHLAWWPEPNGTVLRQVFFLSTKMSVGAVTVLVRDSTGNVVPSPLSPPPVWHESFRYFRLSQTTEDLFDAFRNAYLALESVLSSIAPQRIRPNGRVGEGEGEWFERALTEADKVAPLADFVPPGTSDPVQHLKQELYSDMRGAMSHAKSGRAILLPQTEADRAKVTASLSTLTRLYLTLVEKHLQMRRLGGGITAEGFRLMATSVFDAMTLSLSDDESELTDSDIPPNTLVALTPSGPTENPRAFVLTRLWSLNTSDVRGIGFIRKICGTDAKGNLLLTERLEDRLTLQGAVRFEAACGILGMNTQQPRSLYSY